MPSLVDRLFRRLPEIVLQFVLVVTGVFLGLQADEWRTDREHATAARATLRDIRREIGQNRDEVAKVLPYHRRVAEKVNPLMKEVVFEHRGPLSLTDLVQRTQFDGTKSVGFATTAWDLALTTQTLSYVDPDLAFDLARAYKRQQETERFGDQFLQSLLNTNTLAQRDVAPAVLGMENFFRETTRYETTLVAQYDSLLPRIDAALAR